MNVTITIAVHDDQGVTHTIDIVERSERFGDNDDHPARIVATRAMTRARKAIDQLVPPGREAKAR